MEVGAAGEVGLHISFPVPERKVFRIRLGEGRAAFDGLAGVHAMHVAFAVPKCKRCGVLGHWGGRHSAPEGGYDCSESCGGVHVDGFYLTLI